MVLSPAAYIATYVILLGCAAICGFKGKMWFAVFGLFLPIFWIVGAVAAAKPDSPWAKRRARPAPTMHVADERLGVVDFGCDYCEDDQNRWYGHVEQVGADMRREMILIRCPRCGALYENTPAGEDRTRRLAEDEAEALFPDYRR